MNKSLKIILTVAFIGIAHSFQALAGEPIITNAVIYMDNFLGTPNTTIVADLISMKADALKFRLGKQTYDYSGHYTIVLKNSREHQNPFFGLGSPDKAKFIIIDDFGGQQMILPNVTIWQKSNGFVDIGIASAEWIYSGTYTIQN
jgi:hypothetical protein